MEESTALPPFRGKKGFTLAEVLITLAVIGTVAALTIPTVIKNYQKHEAVTQLKKIYSTLRRVQNQIIFENGGYDPLFDIETIDKNSIKEYCNTNWKPKLKISKECANALACGYSSNTPFKDLRRHPSPNTKLSDTCTYLLEDGAVLDIKATTLEGGYTGITVDVNGARGPNAFGVDVFSFITTKTGSNYEIKAFGWERGCSRLRGTDDYCSLDSKRGDGESLGCRCAARIIYCDSWEIKYY